MTQKGWRIVKPQHNNKKTKQNKTKKKTSKGEWTHFQKDTVEP